MELKEFIINFANQFDDTDPTEITASTQFKDLEEWSSLTALSLIAMVDDNYDVLISNEDIHNANTVEDLYNIVKERIK